jgi:hypothetical protein
MHTEVLKVDERLRFFIIFILTLLVAPLFLAISPWLLTVPLFFTIAILASIRKARYSVIVLEEQKKICKISQDGKRECMGFESAAQIRLTTLHRYWKYCVAVSTKDAQLELIVTGKYAQAKHFAEKAASITGASLFIDELVLFHRLGVSHSTMSPNNAVNSDAPKAALSGRLLP